jgi:HK97 family phage prohead protease
MKHNLTIPLEVKNLQSREFDGHGSVFGNEDFGGDVVVPGAFRKSLAEHREAGSLPQMFWMHDPAQVAGKWTEMAEDETGLKVKGVLADTPLGNEIHTLLKMDAVRGLSIGYRTIAQDWKDDGTRLIKEAELWEVSVVSLPMNPLAQVAHVKSRLSARGEYVTTAREFEKTLRDVGYSQRVAKVMVSKIYEGEVREAPPVDDDELTREVLAGVERLKEAAQARELERIFQRK